LLILFVSVAILILIILYFHRINHLVLLYKPLYILFYSVLFFLFFYSIEPLSNIFLLLSFILITYSLLEDSLTKEFDYRYILLGSFLLLFNEFNTFVVISSIFLYILLIIFVRFGFLSNGEPFLILPFVLLLPLDEWFVFLFLSFLSGFIFLILLKIFFKIKSFPFSYFLMISFIYVNLFY
jgi:hypothetical protein